MAADAWYRLVTLRRTRVMLQQFDGPINTIPAAQCRLRVLISGS
ncbi:hypothetical protein ACFPPF_19205 [Xenophilus aerolatus]|nr:hypothetical protein [Xenophilus aerolatus]